MNNPEGMSFEEAFSELEQVIIRLESADLSLEESVELFEKGRKLSTLCEAALDKAELRIQQIMDDGSISTL